MYTKNVKEYYGEYYDRIYGLQNQLVTHICEVLAMASNDESHKMVEHLTTRIKTKDSIERKLTKDGYIPNIENGIDHLSDLIGIRLVVHFISDIYKVRDILVNSKRFQIVKEKDYVKQAKKTGYRGYHIIIQTDLDDRPMQAEIQIRTVAMDCWASLEHDIRYKKDMDNIDPINDELLQCSKNLMDADIAMEQIWSKIQILRKEQAV